MNEPKPTHASHDRYRLLSLVPAPAGAKAVYCADDGLHTWPISFLATAEVTTTRYQLLPNGKRGTQIGQPSVSNAVVAVEYCQDTGFKICEEVNNFCGVALTDEDIPEVCYTIDGDMWDRYDRAKEAYLQARKNAE